jgi:hypothetical protein
MSQSRQRKAGPEPKSKFKKGDRVQEAIKFKEPFVSHKSSTEIHKRIANICADDRVGTVEDIVIIKNSAGRRCVYIDVLWDGSTRSSRHAQTRLTALDN